MKLIFVGHIGSVRCQCQREAWSNSRNTAQTRPSTDMCVAVAIGETTESQGHVYTTIAGKNSLLLDHVMYIL